MEEILVLETIFTGLTINFVIRVTEPTKTNFPFDFKILHRSFEIRTGQVAWAVSAGAFKDNRKFHSRLSNLSASGVNLSSFS